MVVIRKNMQQTPTYTIYIRHICQDGFNIVWSTFWKQQHLYTPPKTNISPEKWCFLKWSLFKWHVEFSGGWTPIFFLRGFPAQSTFARSMRCRSWALPPAPGCQGCHEVIGWVICREAYNMYNMYMLEIAWNMLWHIIYSLQFGWDGRFMTIVGELFVCIYDTLGPLGIQIKSNDRRARCLGNRHSRLPKEEHVNEWLQTFRSNRIPKQRGLICPPEYITKKGWTRHFKPP